jgi:hypothetical protein
MRTFPIANVTLAATMLLALSAAVGLSQTTAAKPAYPAMAPLSAYLMPSEQAEITLARSAAPASIADHADVMVLRRDGFATVVHGSNGFVCVVERSWAKPTTDAEFWNPKMRAPTCFNAAAAKTFLPIFLMRTKLVLAGKSPAQILAATNVAFADKRLPTLARGGMGYMMSRQQYLSDTNPHWHPHYMFFEAGDAEKRWGADAPDSPIMAGDDPEERATVFFVVVDKWTDGTPGPAMTHQ